LGVSGNGFGLAITSQTYSGLPPSSTNSEETTTFSSSSTNTQSISNNNFNSYTKPYNGINPQLGSLLFNGRIPAEIRNQIFREALTEYANTAKRSDQSSNKYAYGLYIPFSRPDYDCPLAIATNLLLTCRIVHHEVSHLPISINEHRLWFGDAPSMHKDLRSYIGRMSAKQRLLINTIKLYKTQFYLETTWAKPLMLYGMDNIKSVTITIGRRGWRRWEGDFPLAIDPRRGPISNLEMTNLWQRLEREKEGAADEDKRVGFKARSWGLEFQRFKRLEEIVIEFETVEYQIDQLREIVKQAQDWVFPTHTSVKNKVFKAEDGVETEKWMGPKGFVARTRQNYDNGDVREGEPVVLLRKRWRIVDGDAPIFEA